MPDRTLRLFALGAGDRRVHGAPRREELDSSARHRLGGAVAESAGTIGATLTEDGQPSLPGGESPPRRPAGLDPAERLRGWHGRVVPGHGRGNRSVVLPGETNAGTGRGLRSADPPERGPACPQCRRSQRTRARASAAESGRPESSSHTPTVSACGSSVTAAGRRRSRPAQTSPPLCARTRRQALGRVGRRECRLLRDPLEPRRSAFEPISRSVPRQAMGPRSSSARAWRTARPVCGRRRLLAHASARPAHRPRPAVSRGKATSRSETPATRCREPRSASGGDI